MPTKPTSKTRPWLAGVDKTKTSDQGTGYERPRSAKEYHTSRWTKQSRLFRDANPLCVMCKKEGRIVPAEVVDHIIPYPICEDFWDVNNWQALCKKCNAIKGNRDKKKIQEFKI